MSTSLLMFLIFIAITLVITYWAARRSSSSSAYFAAGRQIKGGKTASQWRETT